MISTSHAVYFLFEHIIHAAVFMEILDKLKLFVNKKVEFFPAFTAADIQKESIGPVALLRGALGPLCYFVKHTLDVAL